MKKVTEILAYILAFSILWAAFAVIVWFVCFCFSIQFSILKSTGIWVVLIFIRSYIKGLLKEIKK